jgi:FKBP-type peptidyl-prolyl cis-trans isomerase FkpA
MCRFKSIYLLFILLLASQFADAQTLDWKTLPSGITYAIVRHGKGTYKPVPTDNVMMHIRVYVSDSMAFDSYKLNDEQPVPSVVNKPAFNGDIMEGLALMVEGDSAVFKIPQDSVYKNSIKPPFAKPGDSVIYQIDLVSVKSRKSYEEEKAAKAKLALVEQAKPIKDYVVKQKLKNNKKLPSGLNVAITQKGTGPKAKAGDKVKVNYTGKLMDGTVFDSSVMPVFMHVNPYEFELGRGHVIKGWDEGIAQLNKGAKATLVIPSPLAYGENGQGAKIKANSILVFDVELVDIIPQKK